MPLKEIITSRLGLAGNMEKTRVVRCLFGTPNHEDLRRDLAAQLKNTGSAFKKTWNYDEDLDQAMQGRFQWEEVSTTEYVPEFYRRTYRKTKFRSTPVIAPKSKRCLNFETVSERLPVLSVSDAENTTADEKAEALDLKRENETTPELRVVRQTKIDEYMKVKKRRLDESDSENEGCPPSKRRC
ncbi:cyclin-dependent kinase inhibitor 1B-like [Mya arenaria]|uniref:cyclin-dependent kinase inhibitor 1B-like n=1 Tax=Mya arenaria TaxID=6604 RepID=UPI0022E7FA30|nr:cyclin-dependent kinase inhibitor 1B-like [Mya arenaria]